MNTKIQTYTGKAFDYLNPTKDSICLDDIAWSLAHVSRFGGHLKRGISVAGHCISVADTLKQMKYDAQTCLTGLMHDAAEAYVGDVPKPMKNAIPEVKYVEETIHMVISEKYNLTYPYPDAVAQADVAGIVKESQYFQPWFKIKTVESAYGFLKEEVEYLECRNEDVWSHLEEMIEFAGGFTARYNPTFGFGESIADLFKRVFHELNYERLKNANGQ